MCGVRAVRHPERQRRRLRRGRRTARRSRPTARRARRSPPSPSRRDRRDRAQARHRPDRVPPEERRQARARKAAYGPTFRPIGYVETLEAAKKHPHYTRRSGRTRAAASPRGFWFNIGGELGAGAHRQRRRHRRRVTGNPDIGGSRASLAMMAAEELGIADRERAGRSSPTPTRSATPTLTGGSRVDLRHRHGGQRGGREGDRQMSRARRARSGRSRSRRSTWKDGTRCPAGANAGDVQAADARRASPRRRARTGGPIGGRRRGQRAGRRPGLRHPHLRRRGRPRDRQGARSCATPRSRTSARRSIRATSRARCRAAPCRASAGR